MLQYKLNVIHNEISNHYNNIHYNNSSIHNVQHKLQKEVNWNMKLKIKKSENSTLGETKGLININRPK